MRDSLIWFVMHHRVIERVLARFSWWRAFVIKSAQRMLRRQAIKQMYGLVDKMEE